MIIYPLPAHELDDRTLSRQIKNIAQVLCQIHFQWIDYYANDFSDANRLAEKIPLQGKKLFDSRRNDFADWGYQCRANYLKLVEMGLDCCVEYNMRFNDYKEWMKWKCEDNDTPHCTNHHKLEHVIFWARSNVPELPTDKENHPLFKIFFPVVLPRTFYKLRDSLPFPHVVTPYRNYYRAKIKKKLADFISDEQDKEIAVSRKLQMAGVKFTRREKPEWLNDL